MASFDLPRFRLIEGPSPFHPLPRLSAALGQRVAIWVKREDLLPVGLGGNKLRNLEFLIGAAMSEGSDTLVTVGRRWSNHARLTAAGGARAGLDVHLVLSGPRRDPPNPGVMLDELFGATVHQASTDDRRERDDLFESVLRDLSDSGRRPYRIAAGGSGAIGAMGQVFAGHEMFSQAEAAGVAVDDIYLPSATGGTQAGLIVATATASPRTRVRGVIVARPAAELRAAIESMVSELTVATDAPASAISLDEAWLGDGYGRATDEADEAIRLLARTEGLLVDPIYTGKALAALIADVRAGSLDGHTVVFWHAGGLPGLFEPLDH